MRGFEKFLLISGALVVVTSVGIRHLFIDEDTPEAASLKSVFPQAERFLPPEEPLPLYRAIARDWQTGQTETIGYCFDTALIVPQVRGFAGPIHILVGMDLSGHLVGLKILQHNETPAYVRGLEEPWFSRQFIGRGFGDPLEIGADLDGISGATITSRAVARSVREGLAAVAMATLGSQEMPRRDTGVGAKWWLETIFLLGLMTFTLAAFWKRKRAWRTISLLLGVAFVGFYLKSSLSVVHIVNLLSLRFPPFPEHIIWYLILTFSVAAALLVGRIYCGWICPFGALQEFFKKLFPYRLRLSPELRRRAGRLRKFLLWLILCLVVSSGNQELLRYEPFALAFGFRGTVLMWVSLVLVLGASLFIDRFWCRYFCVVGMALHLLGKLGLRRVRGRAPRGEKMQGDF